MIDDKTGRHPMTAILSGLLVSKFASSMASGLVPAAGFLPRGVRYGIDLLLAGAVGWVGARFTRGGVSEGFLLGALLNGASGVASIAQAAPVPFGSAKKLVMPHDLVSSVPDIPYSIRPEVGPGQTPGGDM